MKGIKRYDFTKGHKFITYAHWWIRQSISRSIDDQSRVIRLPVYVKEALNKVDINKNKINRVKINFLEKYNRQPTLLEISKLTGIDSNRILKLTISCNEVISLESSFDINNNDSETLQESIEVILKLFSGY